MVRRRDALGVIAAMPFGIAGENAACQTLANSSVTPETPDWDLSPDGRQFPEYQICFSKGLQHSLNGYPERETFENFCRAIQERDINAFEGMKLTVPWVDPTAGSRLSGTQIFHPHNGPWFDTRVMLGDMAELYWAALIRDVPFGLYGDNALARQAKDELVWVDAQRFSGSLFKMELPEIDRGGFLSQFLIQPVPLNGTQSAQRILCPTSSNDFMTTDDSWAACQNGDRARSITTHLETPRYIFNGRALAEFVRYDFAFQAFLWAGLILQSWGRRALNPGLAGRYTQSSSAFVNNGWPRVFALLAEASEMALQDVWFWKWRIFRRLRPEELGGRYSLATSDNSAAASVRNIDSLDAVKVSKKKFGTTFLAQAYPEGAPMHPSFPAGHAEIAGACVTILKAFSDPTFLVPSPILPSNDGLDVTSCNEAVSIEGELNKLAWNMAFGRCFAEIHYRSDCEAGLLLGEDIALKVLSSAGREIAQGKSTLRFRRFDGSWTSVSV
jgi:hypothetical protein